MSLVAPEAYCRQVLGRNVENISDYKGFHACSEIAILPIQMCTRGGVGGTAIPSVCVRT